MTANFLLVSDDKYVKNLGICTYSVMHQMSSEVEKLRIFVMDCGITEANKERLTQQAKRFDNVEMVFYNIEKQLDAVVPKVPTKWHRAIYGRLFMDEVVRQYEDIGRLIYLDCDILMEKPVTELFTMDLEGKCVAAVADADNEPRKKALGIPADCTYVNSGVLVIDTAKWMALDASRRIIEYINSFPEALMYPDQDGINYVLAHEILILGPRYNMMWMICPGDIPKMLRSIRDFYYIGEQLKDALYNASIYHYAGHDMWRYDGVTPVHGRIFDKYRKLCDWHDCRKTFSSPIQFVLWLMMTVKRIIVGDWR